MSKRVQRGKDDDSGIKFAVIIVIGATITGIVMKYKDVVTPKLPFNGHTPALVFGAPSNFAMRYIDMSSWSTNVLNVAFWFVVVIVLGGLIYLLRN